MRRVRFATPKPNLQQAPIRVTAAAMKLVQKVIWPTPHPESCQLTVIVCTLFT